MKNQNELNYTTLTFTKDDLKLIDEALCKLHYSSTSDNKRDELNRIICNIMWAMYPENYECSDSSLMNS